MKTIIVCLYATAAISLTSCGVVRNNQAKIDELTVQIQLVNQELSDLNNNYAVLNSDLDAARDRMKKVQEAQFQQKEEAVRKEQINTQIAYMKKIQTNIHDIQAKINEKQERMAMLSSQMAKLE